jgi:hypothetical protein
MAAFLISQLTKGKPDAMDATVVKIYSKNGTHYAVYRTQERVMVQVDDDPEKAKEQRTALASLNLIRGQINGLIDGWRSSNSPRLVAKASRYDDQVAASLIMCLEDDPISARQTLLDTKQDIIAERSSWARFQYLICASITGAILYSILCIVSSAWFKAHVYGFSADADILFTAAQAGTIGAFFSIAIAIRNRTILTDLRQRDNAADAILRMLIGVIAAGILICLLRSKAVTSFKIGDADATSANPAWMFIVVLGFIAGFFERLVPDMLAKSARQGDANLAEGGNAPPRIVQKDQIAKDQGQRDQPAIEPGKNGDVQEGQAQNGEDPKGHDQGDKGEAEKSVVSSDTASVTAEARNNQAEASRHT